MIGVGIAGAGALLTGVGIGALLGLLPGEADRPGLADLAELLPFGLPLVLLGAAAGLFVAGTSVGTLLTEVAGHGGEARAIRRHVVRGEPLPSGTDPVRPLQWARIASRYLPYQTVSFGLLYAGLLANQVVAFMEAGDRGGARWWSSLTLAVVLVGFAVVLVPVMLRQAGRARRYVEVRAEP